MKLRINENDNMQNTNFDDSETSYDTSKLPPFVIEVGNIDERGLYAGDGWKYIPKSFNSADSAVRHLSNKYIRDDSHIATLYQNTGKLFFSDQYTLYLLLAETRKRNFTDFRDNEYFMTYKKDRMKSRFVMFDNENNKFVPMQIINWVPTRELWDEIISELL